MEKRWFIRSPVQTKVFYVFSYDPFKSGRVQETEKGIDFSLLRWVDVKIGAQSLL